MVLFLLAMAISLLVSTASAQAAAPKLDVWTQFPDTAEASPGWIEGGIWVKNEGDAEMTGVVTTKVTVPSGLSLLAVQSEDGQACAISGQVATCEGPGSAMPPGARDWIRLLMQIKPGTEGDLISTIEVSGGGVPDSFQRQEVTTIGPPGPFEFEAFEALVGEDGGGDETQAGAAPRGVVANYFSIPTFAHSLFNQPAVIPGVTGHLNDVIVHTPAGISANFRATPTRCTSAQLGGGEGNLTRCPPSSQIGVAYVLKGEYVSPVYNMVPPPGVPAQFGFSAQDVPTMVSAHVRAGDYGVDLISMNTNSSTPVGQVKVALWAVPADPSHDTLRNPCIRAGGFCPAGTPPKAFLRLPTSCSGPLHWEIEADTYEEPGVFRRRSTTTPAQVGCNQLEFTPSIEARPSTNLGDSPSGLDLNLHLPQNEDPEGLAQAHVKDVAVKLPEGLTVNSASADGLEACSPDRIGLLTQIGQVPASFDGAQPRCPDASKLGSVLVNTPAIDHPLPGTIYLAEQGKNPFGSLLALYLVINDPESGILVKVPIRADLDPRTGRLTTTVTSSPQLPFEDLTIELDRGAHAPLRTPVACGRFSTTADMTPWSAPEGKDAHPSASFEISKGAGGGSCVGAAAQAPFEPSFSAGTLEPRAGAFSPYVIKISRPDGSQELGRIDLNLPKGLLASLRGIPYCSDGALAAVSSELGSGAKEIAQPSCPLASQIGSVSAAVGAGPSPLNVNTGKAFWAGPYKGAPVSMAVIFPAVAGPFDLGSVVVRTGFYVDPETAQITAKSDPLPSILKGIPIDIRSVRIDLDRPNYGLNPTSCDPMSIEADLSSSLGATVHRSERFQVGGCDRLAFKPKLGLRLKGGTKRGRYPALTATLTFPKKLGANTAKASVALPHSEFLAQNHIGTICTRVQFKAHQCPQRSIYGYAWAYSPILDYYLGGPVYLRSSSHELPDLVADLNGQIEVALVGRIDTTKADGIRTTFESVPDAPVSKFVLRMFGGKKGLLQNSTNLCRGSHRATAVLEAHNGMSVKLRPELRARCGKKAKKNKKKRHGGRGY